MKKLIFILFCIPFFVIGQSKKELKQTVVQYQDTISNLNSIIKLQKEESIKMESSEDILKTEISDLDIEITEIKNKNNLLIREKKKLVRDNEVSSKKEEENKNKITTLEFQISQLEDSWIASKNEVQTGNILIDSLKNISMQNIISLNDLIKNSNVLLNDIIGDYDLETLLLQKELEFINFDDIQEVSLDHNIIYSTKNLIIDKIDFVNSNIATIKLKEDTIISCLYEIQVAENFLYSNTINLVFINTDKREFSFSISKYGGAFIYQYDYQSFLNFCNLFYGNKRSFLSFDQYDPTNSKDPSEISLYGLSVIGIIKKN